jgi:hypothetical protein
MQINACGCHYCEILRKDSKTNFNRLLCRVVDVVVCVVTCYSRCCGLYRHVLQLMWFVSPRVKLMLWFVSSRVTVELWRSIGQSLSVVL